MLISTSLLVVIYDIIFLVKIMIKKMLPISVVCILIDQVLKIIIDSRMILNTSEEIISGFFNISYVQNYGAAWSMLNGNRVFLILVAIFSLGLFYTYFIKNKELTNLEMISYGILVGGIMGNLLDRIIYGYVIDYLDFRIFTYDFPVFNFADICIVISVGLIIIKMFIEGDKNAKIYSK